MELRELHEVVWGNGYELYCVDDESTSPAYVGHFGFDDAKPNAYLGCIVTGIECAEGKLEVTTANPKRKKPGSGTVFDHSAGYCAINHNGKQSQIDFAHSDEQSR